MRFSFRFFLALAVSWTVVADTVPAVTATNLPQDGKILFLMGDSSSDVHAYKTNVLDLIPDAPQLRGVSLNTFLVVEENGNYQDLSIGEPLVGIFRSGQWGDGYQNLEKTLKEFPRAAIALGVDLNDNIYDEKDSRNCRQQPLRAIAETGDEDVKDLTAEYHKLIDKLILMLKGTERPVYLRIGPAFDGDWNCYKPEFYIKAFRHIKGRINALAADNIATVWQSGTDKKSVVNKLSDWYPGDNYVDWVGITTFMTKDSVNIQIPSRMLRMAFMSDKKLIQTYDGILNFARAHNKPVIIAEATPRAFNLATNEISPIYKREDKAIAPEKIWDSWYSSWFNYIEENRDVIRAVSYTSSNWYERPLRRCDKNSQSKMFEKVPVASDSPTEPACPGGIPWGDSRIYKNEYILKRFLAEIGKDIYVR